MIRRTFSFRETFAAVLADTEEEAGAAVDGMMSARSDIEAYIARDPFFRTTFSPCEIESDSPVVRGMADAAWEADVGPMAAVAGAVAWAGVIAMKERGARFGAVDNGGDLAFFGDRPLTVGLFAGDAPLSGAVAFRVPPSERVIGICTSSATVGPSVSLGVADAVTVFAEDPFAADAWATAICNGIRTDDTTITERMAGTRVQGFFSVIGNWTFRYGRVPPLVPARVNSGLITAGDRL